MLKKIVKIVILGGILLFNTVAFGYSPVKFTYDDGIEKREIVVNKKPTRIVTLSHFMTETLLALGQGENMVGSALLDSEILPEYKSDYDKVKVLDMGQGHNISKEAFIGMKADFVSGWEQSIAEEGTGSLDELIKRGVTPFVSRGLLPNATIEDVYEDFRLLGEIFEAQDKAEIIIKNMQSQLEEILKITKNIKDRPRVLIYDSGDSEAFVGGSGLPNNLVELAGGKNIFADLGQDYGIVSMESVIARKPEIIIITEYMSGPSGEEKIKLVKKHPSLKNTPAVKNNRIYTIGLADLSPGVRNATTVKTLYHMIHGIENESQ